MILMGERVHLLPWRLEITLITFLYYIYLVEEGKVLGPINNLNIKKSKQNEIEIALRWSKLNHWNPQKDLSVASKSCLSFHTK